MTEDEAKDKTCWKSMVGPARKCLGSKCVAWEFYDDTDYTFISKGEYPPEGYVIDPSKGNSGPMTFKYIKVTRTGKGGCGALPIECNVQM